MLDNDFFLVAAKDAFMEAARQFLFENYCRIHQVRLPACLLACFVHSWPLFGVLAWLVGACRLGRLCEWVWEAADWCHHAQEQPIAAYSPCCPVLPALPARPGLTCSALLHPTPPHCAGHQHPQPERETEHGRGGH